MGRNFVAGVAAETVDPSTAPNKEGIGQIIPQSDVTLIHLNEVFPDDIPGSRTFELAIVLADEPLRMLLPFGAAPTRVVNDQVEHESCSPRMYLDCQFPKLVHPGGASIKLDQCWINLSQVLQCIGRPVAPEPSERGGCRAHRQQVHDPASEPVDDVRQFCDERPQRPAGRDHGEAFLIQRFQDRGVVVFGGGESVLRPLPKHARERAIHRVGGACPSWVDANPYVRTFRPVLETVRIDRVGFSLKITNLGQWQGDRPLALRSELQRQVPPGRTGQGQFFKVGLEDFLTDPIGPPQIGSQPGLPPVANVTVGRGENECE